MSEPSQERPEGQDPALPPLRWCSWPLRESWSRSLLVVIALLIGGLLVRWLTGQTYLAVAASLALVLASWRFFIPVEFALSERGVDQRVFRRRRRISWQAIRRSEVCSAGVLLLPDEDRSVMAPFRGLYVPWKTHREEVLAHVRRYVRPQSQAEGQE